MQVCFKLRIPVICSMNVKMPLQNTQLSTYETSSNELGVSQELKGIDGSTMGSLTKKFWKKYMSTLQNALRKMFGKHLMRSCSASVYNLF